MSRRLTRAVSSPSAAARAPGWGAVAGGRGAEAEQRGGQFPGQQAADAQRAVVGHHLDQQRDRAVGLGDHPGPGERAAQRGERDQHEIVPGAQVGALVGEDGGELRGGEQVKRARRSRRSGSGCRAGSRRPPPGSRSRARREPWGRRARAGRAAPAACAAPPTASANAITSTPQSTVNRANPATRAVSRTAVSSERLVRRDRAARRPAAWRATVSPPSTPACASLAADADREQRADGREAAGQAKCLPQQNRGRRGPARPGHARHRACASHAPHGDRGEKYRVGQCPHNRTPLSPSVSSSWCSRSRPDRASRSTSASAPDTLCANLASAASRSPVCASAVSISSATYASRVAAGRYRQARPSRSLRANPFFASRSSTVITVV